MASVATTPVTIAVPGKLILTGEHAAVYRRPALIAAVDLWLRVCILPREEAGVAIDLLDLDHSEVISWDSIRAYTEAVREKWGRYARDGSAAAFAQMRGEDPAHLVKVALGEAARFLDGAPARPLHLRIASEQPVGAGFGSSAAVAVGVTQAYLAFCGVMAEEDALQQLALDVECRQHGLPSGIDPVTVLHGGILWAEKTFSGSFRFRPVAVRSPVLRRLRVFHSGLPAESTGVVVAAVRERWGRDPMRFHALLDRMEQATHRLRDLLRSTEENPEEMLAVVQTYEACLEELGVVPKPVRGLIRRIEARGGAAKISGAGALTGAGAGSLLVYHPDPETSAVWDVVEGLPHYPVRLGVEGAREEVCV